MFGRRRVPSGSPQQIEQAAATAARLASLHTVAAAPPAHRRRLLPDYTEGAIWVLSSKPKAHK
jgi:hypothetical protein